MASLAGVCCATVSWNGHFVNHPGHPVNPVVQQKGEDDRARIPDAVGALSLVTCLSGGVVALHHALPFAC